MSIILPPESRELAERIAAHLGGASTSQAIRFALEAAARELGLTPEPEAPAKAKKKRRRAP